MGIISKIKTALSVAEERLFVVPSGFEPGQPLRNCPVGNFREEPDCRGGLLIQNH